MNTFGAGTIFRLSEPVEKRRGGLAPPVSRQKVSTQGRSSISQVQALRCCRWT